MRTKTVTVLVVPTQRSISFPPQKPMSGISGWKRLPFDALSVKIREEVKLSKALGRKRPMSMLLRKAAAKNLVRCWHPP
jgi:hypothetical protein